MIVKAETRLPVSGPRPAAAKGIGQSVERSNFFAYALRGDGTVGE